MMRQIIYAIQKCKEIYTNFVQQLVKSKNNKILSHVDLADDYVKKNNYQLAFKYYDKAARKGNIYSQVQLGHFYYDGNSAIAKDFDLAIYWYKKAAEQDDIGAQINLVDLYRHKNQPIDSAYWCLKVANKGNIDFQYKMACFFEEGYGVDKNIEKSFYWKEVSAERGNVDAQIDLGILYWDGNDFLEPDLTKAFYWFEQAAQQNSSQAQFLLGANFYAKGLGGININIKMAIYWIKQSANNGNSLAQCYLSRSYMIGHGVEENAEQALYWAKLAAEQGDKKGQLYLAEVYYHCFEDFTQAFNIFKELAQQGDVESQSWLGYLYLNGEGVAKDIEQANYWYKLAAEQGNEEAIEYLSEVSENF
ncbi:SEL1-like repeat protein [Gilliamella sp. wkB112]|uniref:SEL1-like repeat protein n=1 Tax=Gilliamella sp. wkB112 TaxID=3120257 RepID=UPI00080E694E|nr:SEL1-like repeat protein [Gilliamella apicola]OCG00893.1 hypothetical protein A9G12_03795 [Gilliamella apicola]